MSAPERLYELTFSHPHPFSADPDPFPDEDEMFALAVGELDEPSQPTMWRHHVGRRQPSDLIHTGTAVIWLISSRLCDALRDAGATGWTSRPVDLYGADGELIHGYERLVVTGRCRALHPAGTDHEGLNTTAMLYRDHFDPAGWDGTDVFCPYPPDARILITGRAHDAIEGMSNVHLDTVPQTPQP